MKDLWSNLYELSEDYEVPGTEYLTHKFTERVSNILESIMLYDDEFQFRLVDIPWRDNMGGVVVVCWTDHEGKTSWNGLGIYVL